MQAQESTLQQTRNLVADINYKLENDLRILLLGSQVNLPIKVNEWNLTTPIDVNVSNFPSLIQAQITNFPTVQTVSVNNFPTSFQTQVTNFPAVQTVSVNNFPLTQQVSGSVRTKQDIQNVFILEINLSDSWTRLSSNACYLITIDNILQEEIYIRIFGTQTQLTFPPYSSRTLPCVSNSNEWEIRKQNSGTASISILGVN